MSSVVSTKPNGLIVLGDGLEVVAYEKDFSAVLVSGQTARFTHLIRFLGRYSVRTNCDGDHVLLFNSRRHAKEALDIFRKNKVPAKPHYVGDSSLFADLDTLLTTAKEDAPQSSAECVVCCEMCVPKQVLSGCSHVICDQCLCTHAMRDHDYPICCPSCPNKIQLNNLQVAYGRRTTDAEQLKRISDHIVVTVFKHYLRTANVPFGQCRNPECDEVVQLETPVPLYAYCADCGTRYCVRCGKEPHKHPDCMEAFMTGSFQKDEDFRTWHLTTASERRICPVPKCMASIEKNGGCNHMECVSCKVHFCWLCKAFTASAETLVYDHINDTHGSPGFFGNHLRLQIRPQMRLARAAEDIEIAWDHFQQARAIAGNLFPADSYAVDPINPLEDSEEP
ncbi:helicase [Aphelenchoides avenae]|nr:helicase [Aphelenchus avenae]